jgi:hypothetical protein
MGGVGVSHDRQETLLAANGKKEEIKKTLGKVER